MKEPTFKPHSGDPMIRAVLGLFISTLLLSTAALAKDGSYTCTHGKVVRKIEVKYTEAGKKAPCEVIYTKEGETQGKSIFSAKIKEGFCEEKAKAFAEKLSGMGFPCE
jgi:hypothetical protein